MVIVITLKESKVSQRINVHDDFVRDEFNNILSEQKQLQKAKEIAWDMYGVKVQEVNLIKT